MWRKVYKDGERWSFFHDTSGFFTSNLEKANMTSMLWNL